MIKLAPSILSADFGLLREAAGEAERAGAEYLHIDVMDGHFVPNLTFGPGVVAALRPHSKMIFDCHLMVANPDFLIPLFAAAGADIITVHAEACTHLHRTLFSIRERGKKAGVALNPATPPQILAHVLDLVDLVLVMSVDPGFGGQSFIPSCLGKIETVRKMIMDLPGEVDLEVDGGVDATTAPLVVRAGANVLVAGSAVFGTGDVAGAVAKIRRSANI